MKSIHFFFALLATSSLECFAVQYSVSLQSLATRETLHALAIILATTVSVWAALGIVDGI